VSGRVLLVDDDPGILDVVGFALESQGFDVDIAAAGADALQAARRATYDVIVLDVMLPDIPGTEILRLLRAESSVPIVMLTARDAEVDLVVGLELGADDYVTKPFSLVELASRVRAILRRRALDRTTAQESVFEVGTIRIDLVRHEATVGGRPIHLTPSEFKLLALLASYPGRVFSRSQIMEHLWATPFVGDERACDVHVFYLRRKIGRDALSVTPIRTVRGVGYCLDPPR
jgi:two-component system response regulator RegX3